MMLDLDAIRREHSLPDVVRQWGIDLKAHGREFKALCPFHAEKNPSFTVYAKDGRWRWKCHGCGAGGDLLDFVQRIDRVGLRDAVARLGSDAPRSICVTPLPATDDSSEAIADARAIWEATEPIGGTVADRYLRGRGLTLRLPETLRFGRFRYGRWGPEYPVLVAALTNVGGEVTAVQRTYLTPGGKKADVPKAKLSRGRITGSAIRLAPAAAQLVVAEGLEDSLSLFQQLGLATWTACGTSNLPRVQFPVGVQSVVIGADNDAAGEMAAQKAAHTYAERGLKVRIIRPLPGFKDHNDELRGAR